MADKNTVVLNDKGLFLAEYHEGRADTAQSIFLFDHIRIVRILSGDAKWKIGDTVYDIRVGDILLFNNVTARQIISVFNSPLVFEVFGFSPAALSSDYDSIRLFYSKAISPKLSGTSPDFDEINTVLDLLKRNFSEGDPSSKVITALIRAVAAMICEAHENQLNEHCDAPAHTDTTSTICEAIRYIEENLTDVKAVKDVSDHLHISRGHFHKTFTKYIGITPASFINRARIIRFVYLAKAYNLTILDAALQSGFESSSGFYKTFKSVCGTTPIKYLSANEYI